MTIQHSIIIGFSLIAASILLTGNIKPAQAFGGGKYTINSGAKVAWILNTDTGELTVCVPQTRNSKIYFKCGSRDD